MRAGGGSFLDGEDTVRVQMVGDEHQIYLLLLYTSHLHQQLCHPRLWRSEVDHQREWHRIQRASQGHSVH
jgi:hypothetical protein